MSRKSKKQLGQKLIDKPEKAEERKWLSNTIGSYTPPKTGVYKRDINKIDKDYIGYYRARQEPIFYNAFLVIKSMIFKTDLEFSTSKLKSTLKYYNNLLKFLNIKDFLKQCFEEMYLGQNQGLVLVDFEKETGVIKLKLITYYLQGKQRIFPILEPDSNEISHYNITDISKANKIINQISARQAIQLNAIDESLENDYSVLARVKHLIDLKFKMIESQMKLACRDNQPQLYFTPDYKAFPTPTDASQYNSLLGQVTEGFDNIGKELVNSLESNGLIASQIPMNVMKASLTNKELGFDELIRWIDEQIYLGCGLNGTFLNTQDSNRASAEQGYDNVQETVINDWQDKLVKIAVWILAKVAGYNNQDYELRFKANVNQEMLDERAQALMILKDILPNINTLGYKVTNESVQNILNIFGLEIELNQQDIQANNINDLALAQSRAYNQADIDEAFKDYKQAVNMNYSELRTWGENPKSKLASLTREPINRNLYLLNKSKDEWTTSDITKARKTTAYIARAKTYGKGRVTKATEPYGRNEIAMKNWAYDISKTRSIDSITRAVDVSNLPVSSFGNIENQDNYKSIQTKLKSILEIQFNSWINKLDKNRIDIAGSEYPSLSNSQDEITKLINQYAQIVEADYQSEYGSDVVIPQAKLTKLITQKINQTIKGDRDYQGFDSTTSKLIKSTIESEKLDGNIKDYFDARKESFLANRFKSLEDGIFVNLYYEFSSELAKEDNKSYVGSNSQNDSRVRPEHRINNGRVWKVGSNSPSGRASPWNDFGCRCSYYYNDLKTLTNLGFKQ